MVMMINNQPGPHDHQLGAERKQSMPMKSYHQLPLLLTNTTPSRAEALQAKPKHITLVSFCQHLSTYRKFTQNDNLKIGGAARGTPKVSTGGYNKGQQVGAASKKGDASEHHPLDKGREEEGSNKEYDYSHTRHFPNTNVTMKPENQYSKTTHLQNSNATEKPENHYSQTRQTPKPSSAASKPESPQYSTVGKSKATKKPDGGVNDRVYHTLDMSGENSDTHKDQQDGENVVNMNDTRERENEYSAPNRHGGSDGHISKDAQEGGHEYHVLEGPEHEYHVLKGPGEEYSDTSTGIQSHEYHVFEGQGDSYNSDTNKEIQEGNHEYHILEGMIPEL